MRIAYPWDEIRADHDEFQLWLSMDTTDPRAVNWYRAPVSGKVMLFA